MNRFERERGFGLEGVLPYMVWGSAAVLGFLTLMFFGMQSSYKDPTRIVNQRNVTNEAIGLAAIESENPAMVAKLKTLPNVQAVDNGSTITAVVNQTGSLSYLDLSAAGGNNSFAPERLPIVNKERAPGTPINAIP